jgi:hypothetical protein
MTRLKGMDKLFWGRKFEDVHDWVERLEMALEINGIDELKLFKIGRVNLSGLRSWLRLLQLGKT